MLSVFPRDVLDEIWDLVESVSEGFPTCFRYFNRFVTFQIPVHIAFHLYLNHLLSFSEETPYGTNSVFFKQKMQCPACSCPFSFNEETSVPRVLPCLHTIDTKCIMKEKTNGSIKGFQQLQNYTAGQGEINGK